MIKRFYIFLNAIDVEELSSKINEEQRKYEAKGNVLSGVQFQADCLFYACLEFRYKEESVCHRESRNQNQT